ncbi:MAG: hypothetical protein U9Q21_03650, partial [Candidatus Auribacterota bacterium]|nr:hypothetical protein [Candidatus Auribacterota bacterium]
MRILFGIIILTVAVAFNAFADDSAFFNTGFEEGESMWYNWNDGASSGEITEKYNHSGNKSACREISGEGQGCYGQITPINSGEIIEASVWVMNPSSEALLKGAEVCLRIEFWNDEGPLGSGHVESVHVKEPTGKWIKLAVKARTRDSIVPAGALAFTAN